MSGSIATLPTIIIFERHWDIAPKQFIDQLLPDLADQGYDTFCLEAPHDLTLEEMVERGKYGVEFSTDLKKKAEGFLQQHQVRVPDDLSCMGYSRLSALMRQFVSSQRYNETAEKIKSLPAQKVALDLFFNKAVKLGFNVRGIDTSYVYKDEIVMSLMSERTGLINSMIIKGLIVLLSICKKLKEGPFFLLEPFTQLV